MDLRRGGASGSKSRPQPFKYLERARRQGREQWPSAAAGRRANLRMAMARLKALRSSLRPLEPKVEVLTIGHEAARRDHAEWRKWYGLARWRRLRMQCLKRDRFTCKRCGRVEPDTSRLVADHKIRHGGDPELFWDEGNLQCLCKRCHDGDKQKTEAAERANGWGGGV